MTKEYLEALERLAMPDELHIKECKKLGIGLTEDYDILKQYFESIDNANSSEALKYVNGKIADLEDDLQHYTMVEKDKCKEFYIREDLKQFTNIKQALIKSQEMEKVLKIIFEKNVNIYTFKTALVVMNFTYREYMSKYGIYHSGMEIKLLDEEEFDLLKRYCE